MKLLIVQLLCVRKLAAEMNFKVTDLKLQIINYIKVPLRRKFWSLVLTFFSVD